LSLRLLSNFFSIHLLVEVPMKEGKLVAYVIET